MIKKLLDFKIFLNLIKVFLAWSLEKFPIVEPEKPIFGLSIFLIIGISNLWLKSAVIAVILRLGNSFASCLEFFIKKSLLISIEIYSLGLSIIFEVF